MTPCHPANLAGVLLLLALANVEARGSDLAQRFRADYPAASQKLRQYYSSLRATWRQTGGDGDRRIEFAANGGLLRSVVEQLSETRDAKAGESWASVANPELSFVLHRKAGKSDYYVVRMSDAESATTYAKAAETVRLNAPPPTTPYCFIDRPIDEWLKETDVAIVAMTQPVQGKPNLIRVEWQALPREDLTRKGWFLFDSESCWALVEYHFDLAQKIRGRDEWTYSIQKLYAEYEGKDGDVPVLKRVRRSAIMSGKENPLYEFRLDKTTPGPVPTREFTLAAFGIGMKPVRTIPLAYYLAGLALLTFVIAVCINYKQWRAEREEATP